MSDYKLTLEGNDNIRYFRDKDRMAVDDSIYDVLGFLNRSKTNISVYKGDFFGMPGTFYLPRLQQDYDVNTKPVIYETSEGLRDDLSGKFVSSDEINCKDLEDILTVLPEIKVIEQF